MSHLSLSERIAESLLRRRRAWLREARRKQRAFERRLHKAWEDALDIFELGLRYSLEVGSQFNSQNRPTASKENDFRFEVLTRLHARACSITSEVLTLMRTGHASGAYTRWRTLHEIAVMSVLIGQGDDELAKRYLEHEVIESARAARDHITFQERIGLEPVTEEDVRGVEHIRDRLVAIYGQAFARPYGWAAGLVGHAPTFKDLEERAGLDHWRPYYRMASYGVHANPKGAVWNLGAGRLDQYLVAGVTNAGLADPGHQSLISLTTVTASLLMHVPTSDHAVQVEVMARITEHAGQAFLEAHEEIEKRGAKEGDHIE